MIFFFYYFFFQTFSPLPSEPALCPPPAVFGCYSGEDPPREDLEGTSKRETRVKKNCPRHIKYCLKTHNSEFFVERSGVVVDKF